jgi:hypothetical protein
MSARPIHGPVPNGTRRTIEADTDYRDAETTVDWLPGRGRQADQAA